MTKRAFAVVAHPDDIEFAMAGTMLLLKQAGYELHYMNIANGCYGSMVTDPPETARIRRLEAMESASAMGATFHESLCDDMHVFFNAELYRQLTAVIREVAPEILLVHSPQDYMEDHMNSCRLAVHAAFSRSFPHFETDPPRQPIDSPVTIYHAQPHGNVDPLGQPIIPDFYVNISSVIEEKAKLLTYHSSQKEWLDATQGMGSYVETLKDLSREVGDLSGQFEYAEGWRKHLHFGFCEPGDDPLRDSLSDMIHEGG